jgi:hypothetical protein
MVNAHIPSFMIFYVINIYGSHLPSFTFSRSILYHSISIPSVSWRSFRLPSGGALPAMSGDFKMKTPGERRDHAGMI